MITQLAESLTVASVVTVQNRLSCTDPADLPMALACPWHWPARGAKTRSSGLNCAIDTDRAGGG